MLPSSFAEKLKQKCDIETFVGSYVALKRQGRSLVGLCPFHNEKTPSFHVSPTEGYFKCFGCGEGGDVITFAMKIENLSYIEAIEFLAGRVGLHVPHGVRNDENYETKLKIYEINRFAARFFYDYLQTEGGKAAREYLNLRRLSGRTLTAYGIGAAPSASAALYRELSGKGYSDDLLCASGIVKRNDRGNIYDTFRGRIIFPIIDTQGRVAGFSGRQINDTLPKYLNTSDTIAYKKSEMLFGFNITKKTKAQNIILCEGNIDVLKLYDAGFDNITATLGTALTKEQAELLYRYTKEVIIAYDSDEAGRKATKRASEILGGAGLKVRVLTLDGAKDPDEYLNKYGEERFRLLLDKSAGSTDYLLSQIRYKYDIDDDNGKFSYLNEASQFIATLGTSIERDIYAGRLSRETGVSKTAIDESIRKFSGVGGKAKPTATGQQSVAQHEIYPHKGGATPDQIASFDDDEMKRYVEGMKRNKRYRE